MVGWVARLAPTMEHQHGLVTVRQVVAAGGSREAVRRLVRRGLWEPHEHGVYGPVGLDQSWRRRLMATLLAAGDDARASHRAAGRLFRAPGFAEAPLEISVPRGKRFRRGDVVVHESTDLHVGGLTHVDHLPCTPRARLVVDLGCLVSPFRLDDLVRHLRHVDGLTWDEIVVAYVRHRAKGRNGTGSLRRHIERYDGISGISESTPELVALCLLLDAGYPTPVLQHPVGPYRLDIAFPDRRIDVEVDGRQHLDAPMAEHDRRRDERLRALGWLVIRATRTQLWEEPRRFVREVGDALRRRPPSLAT